MSGLSNRSFFDHLAALDADTQMNGAPLLKQLSLVIAALLLAGAASASDLKSGPWTSACEEEYCVFQKALISTADDTAFAVLEVLINTETGDASIVMTVPLGVAVEPGVSLSASGSVWHAPVKVCHVDGCRATVDVDAAAFGLLLQQPQFDIRYIPFGDDQPRSATVKLEGLVTAISRARP